MALNFKINARYSFEVYPASILGQDFASVEVVSIMNASSAMREEDVKTLHRQVYAHLPEGTPENYLHQTYIKILTPSGASRILATSWIREDTVLERGSLNAVVTIPDVLPQEADIIRQALSQSGFRGFKIEFE